MSLLSSAMKIALPAISGITGALGNTQAARTSTFNQKQSSSSSFTGGTQRTLLPEQQQVLPMISAQAQQLMTNPGARLGPIRTALMDQTNGRFAGAADAVRAKYGQSGGRSGKLGRAGVMMEQQRLGQLGQVDQNIAQMILQEQDRGTSLAERLLSMNFGQTTSGSQQGSSESSGQQVGAGSPLAGGLSGGTSALMTLIGLDQMLRGGGAQGPTREG